MINCAHPTHFEAVLDGEPWRERVRGLRANASTRSATPSSTRRPSSTKATRPTSPPATRALTGALPRLNVFGGCCGTDHRHVAAIAGAVAA